MFIFTRMDLKTRKLNMVQKILSVEKEALLDKIDKILDKEMVVAYTTDGVPLTKEHYNKRLELAEQQIKSGEIISQEDLEKESENW